MSDAVLPDPERHPWAVIALALAHEARSEPISQELQDAVDMAAVFLVCVTLGQAGACPEAVLRQFDRPYKIRLTYHGPEQSPVGAALGLSVEWEDGTVSSVTSNGDWRVDR